MFFVILIYIDRKRLLKRKLVKILPFNFRLLSGKFQDFSAIGENIDMLKNGWISKNVDENDSFKTFYESQAASFPKEIIQQHPPPPAPPPDKSFLRLWSKYFLTEVSGNMLIELRFAKWMRFFERNCTVKLVIFCLFLLALRLATIKSEINR